MSLQEQIKLFQSQKVRTVWDDETEEWYFSVVDVCAILTDQPDYVKARKYWNKLKQRLVEEGFESVTNCHQLKLVSPKDGKKYKTDVATSEQLFRIIQSIPSKKAEPFKQWMARVAAERLNQMQAPELNFEQAYDIFAEASTAEISKARNPRGYTQSATIAKQGGKIAGEARKKLEDQIGHSVISNSKASDYLPPADSPDLLTEPED